MKKLRAVITAAVLGVSLMVTACSGTPDTTNTANGKVTLKLWYWNSSLSEQILSEANQKFPNVNLVSEKIGGNFESKLLASLYADAPPDLTGINSADFVATMVKDHSQFLNLNDFPEVQQAKKDYLDWKWNLASTPDRKYQVALPIDTGPIVLYYNADLFKKAGLPTDPEEVSQKLKTWDDYMAAAKQMKEKINVPMFDNVSTIFTAALNQGNEYYFKSDGTPIYETNPVVKNAWNLAVQAHQLGLSADIQGGTSAWSAAADQGGYASLIGASWMVPQLSQSVKQKGVWRVAAAPGGPGDIGGSFIGIPKNTKNPEEAVKVALWLLNPQNELRMYPDLGLYPSTPSVYDDPLMNKPSDFFGGENINKYLSASAKAINIGFQGPYDNQISNYFKQDLSKVALNNMDPNQAWEEAMKKIKSQMQRLME
ncbi:MAG: lacE3 [Bacilli bacterium]|nr:lacE3 [Bacilli bacterium]